VLLWVAVVLGRQHWAGPRWPVPAFPLGAIALLAICGVIAGIVAIVIRRIAAPVADLVSAADRIAQRDYRVRVGTPDHGPQWIRDTARAFNAMAEQLESQDTARRQMMADVAHELRTPLSIVQGKLEGLIDGVYPRDDERLQGLLDDTRVLARLVEDLRTLSTAESGTLALALEPVDVVSLAGDVVASFDPQAAAAGVTLGLESIGDDIAAAHADPVRVREVITNLVANAVRHTPSGGTVRVRISADATHVLVSVIDTGVGIAPEDLPRIFDRFYKGAASSGSGLGLTIARNLVEAHGGTIRAESQAGKGTAITFTLQREQAE
jgi:signal transduction histidine kinase